MALDPETLKQKRSNLKEDVEKWADGIQDEYNSLLKRRIRQVVDRPRGSTRALK